MDYRILLDRYGRWQQRWRDPMLTGLLVLLALEVFFGLPLLRTSYLDARVFAIAWLLMILTAVLVAARHWIAITAILVSSVIALVANITRINDPTTLTICVGSGSVLLFMVALVWIIWSAVFGPGRVTQHRILGAVVLYLCIALGFASLFEIMLALSPGAITGATCKGSTCSLGRAWFTTASARLHPPATGISCQCTPSCGVYPILSP